VIGLLFSLIVLPVRLMIALVYLLTGLLNAAGRSSRRRPPRRVRSTYAAGPRRPQAAAPTAHGAPPSPSRHLWWALCPAYTFGLVACIPAIHGAVRLRRPRLWYAAAGLVLGNIVLWLLVYTPGASAAASNIGALLALALAVAGTVHALRLRQEVFGSQDAAIAAAVGLAAAQRDPAVAQALAARRRRADAAALAAKDPALAMDLRIGRPDLSRQYYDGGLVDVNHVDEATLVAHLGLSPESAKEVISARQRLGRFESADDLANFADLPPRVLDAVRDRVIAL